MKNLLVDDPVDRGFAAAAKGPYNETRFMPATTPCSIDFAIFGNKIAICSVKKDLFSVVIESEDIATSLRALHELAWAAAKPLPAKVL